MPVSVAERIRRYNQGRIEPAIQLKYKAMRESSFRFFRGTCHLFYEDLPARSPLLKSPPGWICGDLHLENFGSFKGDNRLAYFDLNDFDEACLAPCLLDSARLLTSVFVAADMLKVSAAEAVQLCNAFLQTFIATLSAGYIRVIEKETATGVVRQLLKTVEDRKKKEFLQTRVEYGKNKRWLKANPAKNYPVDKATQKAVKKIVDTWAAHKHDPRFFEVLDVAGRVAGTGSLGLERFIVLVRGTGVPGEEFLLDIKAANPSCVLRFNKSKLVQPEWSNEADRVIEIQKRVQATSPALISVVTFKNKKCILKELQPTEDKLNYALFAGKIPKLKAVLEVMGSLCAWGLLRSSGRQGSATADELIAFAKNSAQWKPAIVQFAGQYAKQVKADFASYSKYFDEGFFKKKKK